MEECTANFARVTICRQNTICYHLAILMQEFEASIRCSVQLSMSYTALKSTTRDVAVCAVHVSGGNDLTSVNCTFGNAAHLVESGLLLDLFISFFAELCEEMK